MFLAFPAIFAASATLIEKHERERKQQRGLHGEKRGTDAAAIDALGAVMGGVGLVALAGICKWLLRHYPAPPTLSGAAICLAASLSGRLDYSTTSSAVIMKSLWEQGWPADWQAGERTHETAINGDSYEYSDSDERF